MGLHSIPAARLNQQKTGADAELRVGLASSILVGIVTSPRIIGVPTLVAADTEELVAVLASAIQQILCPSKPVGSK
ncbi:hypothetical protein FXW78_48865 [Rhodococcus opacus]|nr:hypothetical protein [Rhodococcus opacus]